ncbi:hypothetical protein E2562_019234 [Oryza meyeriana var. granulata]|uniref:Uncharacterized protein n=1 Tax=Oryza meyeriana var. granulata TaxID=110450 RepID=A0A6G1F9Z1_9ORYZ|nr:hypothetical protein E2562_019234 [Oryza meyeriana var. granulata]
MRGRRTRASPRRHGETGGEGRWRCSERSEKVEVEVEVVEGRARRLRSEIGEVSSSLRRITRGEFLAAEGGVHGGAVAAHASSPSSQPAAAPRPTVRTSSTTAADFKPPPQAVATASSKKRKTGHESSANATTTASSEGTKTIPALGQPEVHRQPNKSAPSAPSPPTKGATRFPAVPLPPPNYDVDEEAVDKRKLLMLKRFASTIAKAEQQTAQRRHDDLLKGRANFTAEEELLLLRDAERAKAREALQEVEKEARRTGLCVERILPEHLRELDITADIEYVVSPECHRDEDGVLRFTPRRYSPVMEMLGLFVKADQDGGELELDEEC